MKRFVCVEDEGIPTAIEWGVYRGNPQNTGEYFRQFVNQC